jgi:hypothetical protein
MELKNIRARCIDRNSNDEIVLHEINYEAMENDNWVAKTIQLMATDPHNAIQIFNSRVN